MVADRLHRRFGDDQAEEKDFLGSAQKPVHKEDRVESYLSSPSRSPWNRMCGERAGEPVAMPRHNLRRS